MAGPEATGLRFTHFPCEAEAILKYRVQVFFSFAGYGGFHHRSPPCCMSPLPLILSAPAS